MAKHHPSLFFPGALFFRPPAYGAVIELARGWRGCGAAQPCAGAAVRLLRLKKWLGWAWKLAKDGDHWEKSEKSPWFFNREKWCYHQNGMIPISFSMDDQKTDGKITIHGNDLDSSWIFPSVFLGSVLTAAPRPTPWGPLHLGGQLSGCPAANLPANINKYRTSPMNVERCRSWN